MPACRTPAPLSGYAASCEYPPDQALRQFKAARQQYSGDEQQSEEEMMPRGYAVQRYEFGFGQRPSSERPQRTPQSRCEHERQQSGQRQDAECGEKQQDAVRAYAQGRVQVQGFPTAQQHGQSRDPGLAVVRDVADVVGVHDAGDEARYGQGGKERPPVKGAPISGRVRKENA